MHGVTMKAVARVALTERTELRNLRKKKCPFGNPF